MFVLNRYLHLQFSAPASSVMLMSALEKLEKAAQSLIRRISVTMRFILMQDELDNPSVRELQYRRDIVFSQAVRTILF